MKTRLLTLSVGAWALLSVGLCARPAGLEVVGLEVVGLEVAGSAALTLRIDRALARLVAASLVYDEPAMVEASGELASLGPSALDPVVGLLDHEDSNVRWYAVETIARLATPRPAVLDPLLERAVETDPDVRRASLRALVRLFAGEAAVERAVRAGTRDAHELVRTEAWFGCWRLREDRRAVTRLVAGLASRDWMVVDAATRYLGRIGRPALRETLALARDGSARDGSAAALRALGRIGILAPAVRGVLIAALGGESRARVAAASEACARLGRDPAGATLRAALAACLAPERDRSLRLAALAALGRLAVSAADCRPSVLACLDARDRVTSEAALRTLGALGPPDSEAAARDLAPRLAPWLEARERDLRAAAASAVGRLGATALGLRAGLEVMAASDPVDHLREVAREALAREKRAGMPVVPR